MMPWRAVYPLVWALLVVLALLIASKMRYLFDRRRFEGVLEAQMIYLGLITAR